MERMVLPCCSKRTLNTEHDERSSATATATPTPRFPALPSDTEREGGRMASRPAYRDRARERRQAEADGRETEADASDAAGAGIAAKFAVVASEREVRNGERGEPGEREDEHRAAIERSKFLGGTEEHTHLVKGLDFALLRKVREEIQLREQEDEEEALEEEVRAQEARGRRRGGGLSSLAASCTPTGRAVQRWLLGIHPEAMGKSRVERFLPGRTVYTFHTDARAPTDLPQVSIRSREDAVRHGGGAVDADIMRRLLGLMSSERASKMRKMRKKEKKEQLMKLMKEEEEALRESLAVAGVTVGAAAAAVPVSAAEIEGDDDMFADDDDETGDGAPRDARPVSALGSAPKPTKKGESYFASGGRSDVRSAPMPPPSTTTTAVASGTADGGDGDDKERLQAEARRQKLLERMQDGYDECYPDYTIGFGGSFADDEDDEEGGIGAGDGGDAGKKRKKMKNKDGSAMDEQQLAAAQAEAKRKKKESKFASNFQKIQGIIRRREEERGAGGVGSRSDAQGTAPPAKKAKS